MSFESSDVYDILADQGASFFRTIGLKTAAKKPVDITGSTAFMEIKVKFSSSESIMVLSTENERISIDGVKGNINLYISPDDMSSIPAGKYVYDLELTDGSAQHTVTKVLQGKFTVRAEVTR